MCGAQSVESHGQNHCRHAKSRYAKRLAGKRIIMFARRARLSSDRHGDETGKQSECLTAIEYSHTRSACQKLNLIPARKNRPNTS